MNLHHIIFDPLSAWEQFKLAMLFWGAVAYVAFFVWIVRRPRL